MVDDKIYTFISFSSYSEIGMPMHAKMFLSILFDKIDFQFLELY